MSHSDRGGASPWLTKNTTWAPLAPEAPPWESHTIAVVAIFCCVCLLHLAAFLYTVCFQSRGGSWPAPHLASPGANESEIATFQPSSPTPEVPARA